MARFRRTRLWLSVVGLIAGVVVATFCFAVFWTPLPAPSEQPLTATEARLVGRWLGEDGNVVSYQESRYIVDHSGRWVGIWSMADSTLTLEQPRPFHYWEVRDPQTFFIALDQKKEPLQSRWEVEFAEDGDTMTMTLIPSYNGQPPYSETLKRVRD